MTTKNGFSFYAKKPQYLFLYKIKELLAIFNKEILDNNIEEIIKKKKNIINDIKNLYNISNSYCGCEETINVLKELPNNSKYLNKLYKEDKNSYDELLNITINLITNNDKKIINYNCYNITKMELDMDKENEILKINPKISNYIKK